MATARHDRAPLELWGGVECTVNRVGDRFRDQSALSGHDDRPGDLDLFAELGLSALRTPILWERITPEKGGGSDWRHADVALNRLRSLGIRPIAGLVHHGSGPRHTNLLDDGFATGLAGHAGAVAARYPWIEDWTPVNELLTTARFTALYGHWYPHARDERSFWQVLLNQVDGVRAAMRAIRQVTPTARLIQTDDLGHTFSTPQLADQAAFDNLRRWAGWDLLFGQVTPHHPLFPLLDRHGLGDRVRAIGDDPCPPDILGVNHYLTSDRFLDHRVERYPAQLHGGNGRRAYADTEAVRVLDPPAGGWNGVLTEAWQRYGVPIAMTEVHNGSTREEQMRWAAEAWDAAVAARARGIDVRAVTAWSLLGSHGWNTLLTGDGVYEAGVYDVSSGVPRPTALARLWRSLGRGEARHPVTAGQGWWRRPERLLYPPYPSDARRIPAPDGDAPPLLLCVEEGMLRQAVVAACIARGIHYMVAPGAQRASAMLARVGAWAVVIEGERAARDLLAASRPGDARYASAAPDGAWIGEEDDDAWRCECAPLADHAGLGIVLMPAVARRQLFADDGHARCAHAALDLLIDEAIGVWRVDGSGVAACAPSLDHARLEAVVG